MKAKEYAEFTLEEKMKIYENYQKWFSTLSKEEQENTDDGGFSSFEEFNEVVSWIGKKYNTETLEPIG